MLKRLNKKLLLTLMLAVVSSSRMAEWAQIGNDVAKKIGVDTGRSVKTFVMNDAITKNGDRALMLAKYF